MRGNQRSSDDDEVLTLGELIQAKRGGRSFRDLEAACDGVIKSQRWEHMAKDTRVAGFPRPQTIAAIAEVLNVDAQTVILSTAKTLGMPVRRHGSLLATLLPPDADDLTLEQRNAVLAVVAAMNQVAKPARARPEFAEQDPGTVTAVSASDAGHVWKGQPPDKAAPRKRG